jgi:hypothetical protein
MAETYYSADSPRDSHPLTGACRFLPPDGIAKCKTSALPRRHAGTTVTSIIGS